MSKQQAYAVPAQQVHAPAQTTHTTTTVVVQAPVVQDDGLCCAIAVFIIGWFFFPVWWGGCCGLQPHIQGCARVLNILSTVLGILWTLWIPAVIIWYVVVGVSLASAAISGSLYTGNTNFYSY